MKRELETIQTFFHITGILLIYEELSEVQSTNGDVVILELVIPGQSCGTEDDVCLCVLLHNPSRPQATDALQGVSNQDGSKKVTY